MGHWPLPQRLPNCRHPKNSSWLHKKCDRKWSIKVLRKFYKKFYEYFTNFTKISKHYTQEFSWIIRPHSAIKASNICGFKVLLPVLQQNPTARILYVVRDPRAIFHSIKNIGTMRIDDDLLAQIRHYFYTYKIIISISILDNYKFSKIKKNSRKF